MLLSFLDKPEIYSSIAIAIMGIILFGAIYVLNNLDSFPVWNPNWNALSVFINKYAIRMN